MSSRRLIGLTLCFVMMASPLAASSASFTKGPTITAFGPVADVPGVVLDETSKFRVAFDVAEASEVGQINRRLESAARFINMHTAVGVPLENIDIAVVVHGGAAIDLVNDERFGGVNKNAALIEALVNANVQIILCGQTAAYRDIDAKDLLPGVVMSLSAMTAHAKLQQDGFTLNPF
ncbi:MAG: DsrE family protein [Pseudomonadota bacterium]